MHNADPIRYSGIDYVMYAVFGPVGRDMPLDVYPTQSEWRNAALSSAHISKVYSTAV